MTTKEKKRLGGSTIQKYALLLATLLLSIVFGLLSQTFFTVGNIMNILSSSALRLWVYPWS